MENENVEIKVKEYANSLVKRLNQLGIDVYKYEDEVSSGVLSLPEYILQDLNDETIFGILIGKAAQYTDKIYSFDMEAFEPERMYITFFKEIDKLTNHEVEITNIKENMSQVNKENGAQTQKITFVYKQNEYNFDVNYYNDWFDVNIIFFINKILKENGSDKFLYITSDGYQDCYVFYDTEEWANNFKNELPQFQLYRFKH